MRIVCLWVCLGSVLVLGRPLFAQELPLTEQQLLPLALEEPPSDSRLWLSAVAGARQLQAQSRSAADIMFGATLGMQFDLVKTQADEAPAFEDAEPTPEPADDTLVSPELAREILSRALQTMGAGRKRTTLADTVSRSRASGAVPELRLRVAHDWAADRHRSPTSYDEDRTTESGATGLVLEGRATFRLDRLVFADPEPGLLRFELELDRHDQRITEEVAKRLALWHESVALSADETLEPRQRSRALADAIGSRAYLDAATDGWFSKQLARAPRRPSTQEFARTKHGADPSCVREASVSRVPPRSSRL